MTTLVLVLLLTITIGISVAGLFALLWIVSLMLEEHPFPQRLRRLNGQHR